MKISTLTSSYFKSDFKLIGKCAKQIIFYIFFILFWIVLENSIYWKSFLVWCREFYPVRRLLSSVWNFIQCREIYLVYRLLFSVENFIQCIEFYPVRRTVSNVENFIQCREFYLVWKILSSAKTFIQCRQFYPA